MKKYEKPEMSQILLDEEICAEKICGEGDSWATSTRSGSTWTLCAHFPYTVKSSDGNSSTYGNRNGQHTGKYTYSGWGPCYDIEIKGKHIVNFEHDNSVSYCPESTYFGCGWKKYSSDNGGCHYFGKIYIDGQLLTKEYKGNGTDIKVYNVKNM